MIRLEELSNILPKLTFETVKGNNGLVGVIGGSFEYTGAPFYTAMAAVKLGADIAHIFCSKQAAGPIKSYSPQLIVHPIFADYQQGSSSMQQSQIQKMTDKWVQYFKGKIGKITSWVIGPGLGRGKYQSYFFPKFIKILPKKTNIVIDADGLFFLCQTPQLVENLSKLNCVLTPNHRQYSHLNKILKIDEGIIKKVLSDVDKDEKKVTTNAKVGYQIEIKQSFPVTIILKGEKDIIFHKNKKITVVETIGGQKRCGGIGDVLAGCIACSIFWDLDNGSILASHITKMATRKAFEKHGRSLTGLGVLQNMQEVVKSLQ